jgi:hypothetical protein
VDVGLGSKLGHDVLLVELARYNYSFVSSSKNWLGSMCILAFLSAPQFLFPFCSMM